MTRFTVVIPAFDAAESVSAALDSVAEQTLREFDIVVVDDGSTDETASVVADWAASHSQISMQFAQQSNQGQGKARNNAVSRASGEFVAFLDADDVWLPNKLEVVDRELRERRELDIVGHDILEQSAHGRRAVRSGPATRYEDLLFGGNTLYTSATVARRSGVLEAGGFSEDRRHIGVEDYDLWLRMARVGARIGYLHEALTIYRSQGQGISATERYVHNAMSLLDDHWAAWEDRSGRWDRAIQRRWAELARAEWHALVRAGDSARARDALRRGLERSPRSWRLRAAQFVQLLGLAGVYRRARRLS